jgi:beta-lactamase regulating signal transducer with metallopeptidase domain
MFWQSITAGLSLLAESSPVLLRLLVLSVEIALLAGFVWATIKLFRITTPRLKALLWLVVLAKPVVGLFLGVWLPVELLKLPAPQVAETPTELIAAGDSTEENIAVAMEANRRNLARAEFLLDSELSRMTPDPQVGALGTTQTASSSANQSSWSAIGWWNILTLPVLLLSAWIAGIVVQLIRLVRDLLLLVRIGRNTTSVPDTLLTEHHRIAERLNLTHIPQIKASNAIQSPALVGVWSPTVLLPQALVEAKQPDEIAWLLHHELMHAKMRDPLALALRRCAEVVFFFHPAIWLAGRQWEEAMELACDRALIESTEDARDYAESLFAVLQHQQQALANAASGKHEPTVVGLHATRTQIGRRIAALLENPLAYPARMSSGSVLVVSLLAVVSLAAGISFGQTEPTEDVATDSDSQVSVETDNNTEDEAETSLLDDLKTQYRFARIGSDTRAIHTALSAYYVDNNTGPSHPHSLTTPIAYITSIPKDPFGDGPYQILAGDTENKTVMVRSVGPDGDNDEGMPIDLSDPNLDGDISVLMYLAESRRDVLHEEEIQALLKANPNSRKFIAIENPPVVRAWARLGSAGAHAVEQTIEQLFESDTQGKARNRRTGEIRQDVSRVRADLRSLQVALETYKVDFKQYPERLPQLTTPIAYLSAVFQDPFDERPAPDGWYKYRVDSKFENLLLYSIGPDGADTLGEIEFNPENGPRSAGDIVRKIELEDYMRFASIEISKKVEQAQNDLEVIRNTVTAWFVKNRKIPQDLSQIDGEFLMTKGLPTDVFNEGQPYRYRINDDTILIYSIGPDGNDDGGERVRGVFPLGVPSNGDIAVDLSISGLEAQYPEDVNAVGQSTNSPEYYEALQKWVEENGRENAMLYYVKATRMIPEYAMSQSMQFSEVTQQALKDGWSEETESLRPTIEMFRPAFEYVRQGAQVGFAQGTVTDPSHNQPVPNFLSAQILAKIICVEGRRLEAEGDLAGALDMYRLALTMGCDYSSPKSILINSLIGIALQNIALHRIHDLAQHPDITSEHLAAIVSILESAEPTQGDAVSMFEGEFEFTTAMITTLQNQDNEETEKKLAAMQTEAGREAYRQMKEAMTLELDTFRAIVIRHLSKSYFEMDQAELDRELRELLKKSGPMYNRAIPNYFEARTRLEVVKSYLKETMVEAAVRWYYLEKGEYPESLRQLVPAYLSNVPLDNMSEKPIKYTPPTLSEDILQPHVVYGVGPNKKDDRGTPRYDPTNGTFSGGDLFYPSN